MLNKDHPVQMRVPEWFLFGQKCTKSLRKKDFSCRYNLSRLCCKMFRRKFLMKIYKFYFMPNCVSLSCKISLILTQTFSFGHVSAESVLKNILGLKEHSTVMKTYLFIAIHYSKALSLRMIRQSIKFKLIKEKVSK